MPGRRVSLPERPSRRLEEDSRIHGSSAIPSSNYEAASWTRRLSPWRPSRQHINAALAAEGPTLRARSRSLVANAAYGANASETFAAYVTGSGIQMSSRLPASATKIALEVLFDDWVDEADADGLTNFYGLQTLAARALFDAGEVFVRIRPRLPADGLSVPMQLQLLESEQLDQAMTQVGSNGNLIRQGIEFDAIGRRVAYHFWRNHPGDQALPLYTGERTRVPASSVMHVYKPLRPGQIRGRPWMTPAMVKLYNFDLYEDAELQRKQAAALFMAFLTKSLNTEQQVADFVEGASAPDATGTADLMMESGVMNVLPEGFDVKFSEPADVGPNYEAFQVRQLYSLCAAMGLPYHAVTGDVSKANYSSLRASLIEIRRRILQFQKETLIFQLCRPVFNAWLDFAYLAGALVLPGYARDVRAYRRVTWILPRWDWVDPLKDIQAEKLAVDSGFKARSMVIEEQGDDPLETDLRIAADHEREDELDLAFPIGFTKAPDAPQPGSDVAPQSGDQPPPADQAQQQAAAADDLDNAIRLLQAQPQPIVNVTVPPAPPPSPRTVTRVTKHDEQGRILEIERDVA